MMPCLSCGLKNSLSCHLPHYSCRSNVHFDRVVWQVQVLHEDEEEEDDEGQEQSKEQPDVDEFHVSRRWEF